MMVEVYGIPNCDTIKKARKWLTDHDIEFVFHDYKKEGAEASLLTQWCESQGWKTLLNRRGTTWRKLSDDVKSDVDKEKAITLMVESPSMIKRPVLVAHETIVVGFSADEYGKVFKV